MRQHIQFLFNELYSQCGTKDTLYEKCMSLDAYSEDIAGISYLPKLNNLLLSQKEGRNDDACAWGVLTLCDIADEIIITRNNLSTSSAECNPLELDLTIALNLPGENVECDEINWHAFGVGAGSMDIQAADIAQIRRRVETRIITQANNPICGTLDHLNKLSSLYIDVLAMLSLIES